MTAHGKKLAQKVEPIINQLQSHYAKLEFEFLSLRSAQIVEEASNGNLDFGICFSPVSCPLVKIRTLFTDPMFIALRKDHPALKKFVPLGWEAQATVALVTPKSRHLPSFLEEAILNFKL